MIARAEDIELTRAQESRSSRIVSDQPSREYRDAAPPESRLANLSGEASNLLTQCSLQRYRNIMSVRHDPAFRNRNIRYTSIPQTGSLCRLASPRAVLTGCCISLPYVGNRNRGGRDEAARNADGGRRLVRNAPHPRGHPLALCDVDVVVAM